MSEQGPPRTETSRLNWHEEDGAIPPPSSAAKGKPRADEWTEDVAQLGLGPGEQVLWLGRPSRAVAVHGLDFWYLPMSIVFIGLSAIVVIIGIARREPGLALGGLIPGAMGYFMGFGRLVTEARRRGKARYAVTSSRIIFLWGPHTSRVDSLDLASLSDVSLSERPDGSGTITFGSAIVFHWYDHWAPPHRRYFATPRFELDDNVREVYDIILEARHKAQSRCSS